MILAFVAPSTLITSQTEKDFADISGSPIWSIFATSSNHVLAAGLNWVRIPIGFWAIETMNDEPFLVGTAWTYFLKAYVLVSPFAWQAKPNFHYRRIQWGRKYGIRIYLDLHALPGSQNAWVSDSCSRERSVPDSASAN